MRSALDDSCGVGAGGGGPGVLEFVIGVANDRDWDVWSERVKFLTERFCNRNAFMVDYWYRMTKYLGLWSRDSYKNGDRWNYEHKHYTILS